MSLHSPKCQLPPRICPIFFSLQCAKIISFILSRVLIIIFQRDILVRGDLAIPAVTLEVTKCRHRLLLLCLSLPFLSLSFAFFFSFFLIVEINFEELLFCLMIFVFCCYFSFSCIFYGKVASLSRI